MPHLAVKQQLSSQTTGHRPNRTRSLCVRTQVPTLTCFVSGSSVKPLIHAEVFKQAVVTKLQ
jgi:hypothetical protein